MFQEIYHSTLDIVKSTPETIKVAAAVTPPGLHMLGVSVEEWSFILACVVSLVVIVEKLPMVAKRVETFAKWVRDAIRRK